MQCVLAFCENTTAHRYVYCTHHCSGGNPTRYRHPHRCRLAQCHAACPAAIVTAAFRHCLGHSFLWPCCSPPAETYLEGNGRGKLASPKAFEPPVAAVNRRSRTVYSKKIICTASSFPYCTNRNGSAVRNPHLRADQIASGHRS